MRRLAPVALAAVVLLAGCAPSFPIPGPDFLEDAIEQETGGQVDLTGATVPSDWPSELPLPDGQLISAVVVDGSHNLLYQVADDSVGEALVIDLVALGFAETARADMGELISVTLERDGWNLTVGWVNGGDDGVLLTYNSAKH